MPKTKRRCISSNRPKKKRHQLPPDNHQEDQQVNDLEAEYETTENETTRDSDGATDNGATMDEAVPPSQPSSATLDPHFLCYTEQEVSSLDGDTMLPKARMNIAISYLFIKYFGCPEPCEWSGKGGIQSLIKGRLGIPSNTSTYNVLEHIWACHVIGKVYTGETTAKTSGTQNKVDEKSIEAEMAMNAVEDGMSFRNTLDFVNTWLKQMGKPLWTYHQVQSLVQRLNPVWSKVGERKQGGKSQRCLGYSLTSTV